MYRLYANITLFYIRNLSIFVLIFVLVDSPETNSPRILSFYLSFLEMHFFQSGMVEKMHFLIVAWL
jgi:hypothetical protein